MKLTNLSDKTLQWSHDRGILQHGKPETQVLKLVEEVGELCSNIVRGGDYRDDIGDCIVVLTNLAHMSGSSLHECWDIAYESIKDRKGYLNDQGNFIKEGDPQAKMEFTDDKANNLE